MSTSTIITNVATMINDSILTSIRYPSNASHIPSPEMIKKLDDVKNAIVFVSESDINNALKFAMDNDKPELYYTKEGEENCIYCGDYEGKEGYTFDHEEEAYSIRRLKRMKTGIYAEDGHRFYGDKDSYKKFIETYGDGTLTEVEFMCYRDLLSNIDGLAIMGDDEDAEVVGLYRSAYFSVNPVIKAKNGIAHICQGSCGGVVNPSANGGSLDTAIEDYNHGYDIQHEKYGFSTNHKINAYVLFFN